MPDYAKHCAPAHPTFRGVGRQEGLSRRRPEVYKSKLLQPRS